jgi:hypothetical protein
MCIDSLVVEPRAIAGFPLQTTDHAELSCATASHVVAAFLELHHCRAIEAFLPAFLFRSIDELPRCWILGTVSRCVSFVVAGGAHARTAFLTLPDLSSVFYGDMTGFNPFATPFGDAVDSILGLILLELTIPRLLEFLVEELVDVFEIDVIFCATTRWHMCRILDGHLEDPLKAHMAYAMLAWKPC